MGACLHHILALRSLRQEDHKFEARYSKTLSQNKNNKNNQKCRGKQLEGSGHLKAHFYPKEQTSQCQAHLFSLPCTNVFPHWSVTFPAVVVGCLRWMLPKVSLRPSTDSSHWLSLKTSLSSEIRNPGGFLTLFGTGTNLSQSVLLPEWCPYHWSTQTKNLPTLWLLTHQILPSKQSGIQKGIRQESVQWNHPHTCSQKMPPLYIEGSKNIPWEGISWNYK